MSTGPAVALTVAATDSGAGAGLAADLKSIAANGAHGVFAVTAVTAQNTREVRAVHVLPPDFVDAQIETVVDDFTVAACKTGLLFGVENARVVATRLAGRPNVVVDPVLVTSTGRPIIEDPQLHAVYRERLFPQAAVITPNVAEAEILAGIPIGSIPDITRAARKLAELGARHVVVTGWLTEDEAVDVHVSEGRVAELRAPRVETANVHGSGCSLSAAVTARLALGDDVETAIETAKRYVFESIQRSHDWSLGAGHGPIDHLGLTRG